MGTILAGIFKTTLGGIYGYLAVAAVVGVVSSVGVGWVVHRVDMGKYEALQLRDAVAATEIATQNTEAITQVKDKEIEEAKLGEQQAVEEAAAQASIPPKLKVIHDEIPVFITPAVNARYCIPNGFVGLLNAAIATGSSPDGESTPSLPASQSNDTCTASTVSSVADSIITNIIKPAQQNAEQLNRLELEIVQSIDKYNNLSVPEQPPPVRPSQ